MCMVNGCEKPNKKKDSKYCSMHRARLTRTGRLDKSTPYERMMSKTITNGGCVEYTGYTDGLGYGRVRNGAKVLTHRLSWEHHNGPIPKGLLICHSCDNPPCVNVNHLFLGTNKDNVQDAINKGRMAWQKI